MKKNIMIDSEFITLGQLLKHLDLIGSGGEAKHFLMMEEVFVNGEKEERRGRKLFNQDVIKIRNDEFRIEQA